MALPPLTLVPGIKRGLARRDDARAEVADAALRARRPAVLQRFRNQCAGCGYTAKVAAHLDVHHLNDNHADNDDANLVAACHVCHPYQHVGEVSVRADAWAEGLGKKSGLAHLPELQARDLNLLLRAVGAAMLDPATREDATEIYEELMARTEVTSTRLGAWKAADFAAAMAQLTDEQYAHRSKVLEPERLVFSERVMEAIGREFVADYPSLPVAAWPAVAKTMTAPAAPAATAAPASGAASAGAGTGAGARGGSIGGAALSGSGPY
jgi:intracellular multiplication protein IcmJ